MLGQRLQHGALGVDVRAVARILTTDDLSDEGAVSIEAGEVSGAAQQQGILESAFEMAMGALDAAVFVGQAAVLAAWPHPVMSTQRLIALGQIILGSLVEVPERR